MLKTVITEFDFQALPEALKAEYKKGDDGQYKLDLGNVFVTDKDPEGLKSALEKEREQNKGIKEKFDALEAERDAALKKAELDAAKTKEEITATLQKQQEERDKKWQEKLDEQQKALETQRASIANQHLQSEATKLATELAGDNAALMIPHIKERMKAIPGETPTIEFIGEDGQPNPTMNSESFKSSFLTKEHFKPILVGSKASGGSASDGTASGVSKLTSDGKPKGFNDYAPDELVSLLNENPDEYNRLKSERVED